MIIAIDGPSASGKSTTAKGVAEKLGITHLNTGSMYRGVTLALMEAGIHPDDETKVKDFIAELDIRFDESNQIHLNERNISKDIRSENISLRVSAVSALSAVREKMVIAQGDIAGKKDCVLEGRDIGTGVFPNADHKFFLIADVKVRAERRLKDLEKIDETKNISDLIEDIKRRDEIDSSREHSPLKQAVDAIPIDTSDLTIDEQIEKIVNIINKK